MSRVTHPQTPKAVLYGDPNRRPPRPAFFPTAVPATLRGLPRWVVWGFTWKPDAKSPDKGKWDKPPYNAASECRRLASSTDPKTWVSFDKACAELERHLTMPNPVMDGVGFVFTGGDFFGLDIDNCRDPVTGKFSPVAEDIIERLSTYAEVSPSGTGVKLIGCGGLPFDFKDRFKHKVKLGQGVELEVYDSGRYFTVTGWCVESAPADVINCQGADGGVKVQREEVGTAE